MKTDSGSQPSPDHDEDGLDLEGDDYCLICNGSITDCICCSDCETQEVDFCDLCCSCSCDCECCHDCETDRFNFCDTCDCCECDCSCLDEEE